VQSSLPPLVIVSGAPATGKTTLARRLAIDLRLPCLTKDDLKEALADVFERPIDVDASMELGVAAYAAMYRMAEMLLEANVGLVLESNFRRGLSEIDLRPLVVRGDSGLVHCTAEHAVIRRRYAQRHQRGERHVAHRDADRADGLTRDLEEGRFEPLELAIPTIVVDTSNGYEPAYEEVRDFAAFHRAALLRK
jgi:predicted kinase